MSHSIGAAPSLQGITPKRLATVAILAVALTLPARAFAAIDLTGDWVMEIDFALDLIEDATGIVRLQQSGGSLSVTMFNEAMTGTINPVTGTFNVSSPYNEPTPFGPCNGAGLSGTATPDGNSMSGSGNVSGAIPPPRWCGPFDFTFTAHRDLCGNGVVDPGEACDDGNRDSLFDCCSPTCQIQPAGNACRFAGGPCDPRETCDGVSSVCPADQIAPAGTACRPPSDACDVGETCTGASAVCPPDAGPPDTDGDGVGDLCDPCPATPDAALVKPRLGLSSYDGVDGNDKLVLKAEIPLSSTAAAFLDPANTGVQIDVGSLAVVLPAGAHDSATGQGWKTAASRRTWTFRGTDPLLAVSGATIKLASGKSGARAVVKLTGKKRTFADTLPDGPLSLHLALDPPVATSLSCGAASFSPDGGPAPACKLNATGTALSCH